MTELELLLDNYFAARSIKVDDQRTIAGGVSDLVQATMALEALLAQEYSRGLTEGMETLNPVVAHNSYRRGVEDALKALPEENKLPDADPEYAPGVMVAWSQGRRQALAEAKSNIEKLKEPSND